MKRLLTAVGVGGLTFLLLGGLLYGVVLAGFYEANLGAATGVVREVPIWWAMIVSQLGLAAMVTYLFIHAGVATASAGLRTGAIFGVLYGIAIAFDLFAVTHWSTVTVAFAEPVVTAVRLALGGAVIGWVLGKGRGVTMQGQQ